MEIRRCRRFAHGEIVCGVLGLCLALVLQGCGEGGREVGAPPKVDLAVVGLKSISYAPMFLQNQSCIDTFSPECAIGFVTDDFAAPWAEPIWGDDGRGDLAIMASMGANAVRLYGNDVRFSKKEFFDAARDHNLQVVVGMSSYWYNGNGGPLCAGPGSQGDCFETIKDAYAQNLQGGFLEDGYYHNAIGAVNVMNEPDFLGGQLYLKAMVTALDGILQAEKASGVKPWTNGKMPRLTITWSFALEAQGQPVCDAAHFIKDPATECGPALTFMVQFHRVVQDPQGTVGYTPKNDVAAAYRERWINGFNSFNPADQVNTLLLQPYMKLDMFKGVPMFAGEWHPKPELSPQDLANDLKVMLTFREDQQTALLIGASFFQFQTAYNKQGTERDFGMFNLGHEIIGLTDYILGDSAKDHPVNCLSPSPLVSVVTSAFGGSGVSGQIGLCLTDERPLDVVV